MVDVVLEAWRLTAPMIAVACAFRRTACASSRDGTGGIEGAPGHEKRHLQKELPPRATALGKAPKLRVLHTLPALAGSMMASQRLTSMTVPSFEIRMSLFRLLSSSARVRSFRSTSLVFRPLILRESMMTFRDWRSAFLTFFSTVASLSVSRHLISQTTPSIWMSALLTRLPEEAIKNSAVRPASARVFARRYSCG